MVHTYKGIYSAITKNEITPPAATWMDLEIITLNELSQTEKDKYYIISLICGIKKKKKPAQVNLYAKQTHRHRKQTYGYQRQRRDKLGIWD